MDSLDYTPAQALIDASAAAQNRDYDAAVLILINDADDGDIDITHFISGATGARLVSYLEVLKTRFALQLLGLRAHTDE